MAFLLATITTDSWLPYNANLANFGVAWGLYFTWVHLRVHEWVAIIIMILLELGWQLVQAYIIAPIPYTKDGTAEAYIGGYGFNYANMIWATGGWFLAFLVDLMQKPHWRPLGGYDVDPCLKWEDDQDYYEWCQDSLIDLMERTFPEEEEEE